MNLEEHSAATSAALWEGGGILSFILMDMCVHGWEVCFEYLYQDGCLQ